MLIMNCKIEQGIKIGDDIEIKILNVSAIDNSGLRKSKVASIGIEAPKEITILRKELVDTAKANLEAHQSIKKSDVSKLANILRKKRNL